MQHVLFIIGTLMCKERYSDAMHVCEPKETTSSTFFKMVSTKSSSTYNTRNHTTHWPWPAANWHSDCCTTCWYMKLSK